MQVQDARRRKERRRARRRIIAETRKSTGGAAGGEGARQANNAYRNTTTVDISRGHSNSALRCIIRPLAHKPHARCALIGACQSRLVIATGTMHACPIGQSSGARVFADWAHTEEDVPTLRPPAFTQTLAFPSSFCFFCKAVPAEPWEPRNLRNLGPPCVVFPWPVTAQGTMA